MRNQFSPDINNLLAEDEWLVIQEGYQGEENLDNEARFCLANGRMGNRASLEEGDARISLPANYVHGVFDRSEAFMRELVNTPNWTLLRLSYKNQPIGPESGQLKSFVRVLDLKNGILVKCYEMTDSLGHTTLVETLKFLNRAQPRCGMIRMYVTPLNYEGTLYLENQVDASVCNFQDMPRFRVKHLKTTEVSSLNGMGSYIESRTRDFDLPIGTGAMVRLYVDNQEVQAAHGHFRAFGDVASQFLDVSLRKNQTLRIDKYAAVATGRDCQGVKAQVKRELEQALNTGWDESLAYHQKEMQALWEKGDVVIKGDSEMQLALRFNLFHLMNTPDPTDDTVNIGAKLLHGEEYGGHAYWDTELFVLPFFSHVFPEVARNLVRYRYHLLGQARLNAKSLGYQGAKYPWESADTGEEECPAWTVGYDGSLSRCYVADYEHHVTSAVAYGLSQYMNVAEDDRFMAEMGLEILLETARFWASRMVWNQEKGRFEILQVTGPDEWHEPVDNNAYTNHLARWNINQAIHQLRAMQKNDPVLAQELMRKIHLDESEIKTWQHKADKVFLQATEGLIEQFDGYFDLDEAIVTKWDKNGMPIMPDNPNNVPRMQRKILKQADVVMLLYLLPELFDAQTQRTNYQYYEQRTRHGSSLSPSIHCLMGLRVGDDQRAYQYLERSAYVDLHNNQKNVREGIHAASTGGTWQCVTMGYCGMNINQARELHFVPRLPDNWQEVRFTIHWQGDRQYIQVKGDQVRIDSQNNPITYYVNGEAKTSTIKA